MAKKKKAAKPAARTKLKKTASKGTRKALAAKQPTRTPRSQVLPGMQKVRSAILDQCCEDANDGLQQIEDGTSAVTDARSAALSEMRRRKMSSYVHAGVRFTLNPGVDKVGVKRIKEKEATAAVFSVGDGKVDIGGDAVEELGDATAETAEE